MLPPVDEDAPAPPQLYERISGDSAASGDRQGPRRRSGGVLSLLAQACRKLLHRPAPPPQEEETTVPVSMLDDDLPLLAWRQEVFVEARLQDKPDLTIGEARVRHSYFPSGAAFRLVCS